MSEEAGAADKGDPARLRVHQFAKLRGVCVRTVWIWIDCGKVSAERDEGGRRWWVLLKKNNERERQEAKARASKRIADPETA